MTKLKFRPIHDRVLLRRSEADKVSAGGIILPEYTDEHRKKAEGEILAVGPGRTLETGELRPCGVKPGQRVIFGKYAGTEVSIDGEKYQIVREDDIEGILD